MSPWELKKEANDSRGMLGQDTMGPLDDSTLTVEKENENSVLGPQNSVKTPIWAQLVPFFMSAFFFLSTVLAVFSPFPLLLIFMKKGRKWSYLAAFVNALIVFLARGSLHLILYLVFVVILSLTLAELLHFKKSLEKATIFTLLSMALGAAAFSIFYVHISHLNPIHEFRDLISNTVDQLNLALSTNSKFIDPADLDELKKDLMIEFPSHIAILSLVFIWANLVLLLRSNPNQIREKLGLDVNYFKKWKAPEFLVWPSLISGFFVLVNMGWISNVALNFFRFFMSIYVIQGLSILGYFFDLWKVKKLFRWIAYGLCIFSMLPMVLFLGFFDLWFDFRSKFRQA